MIATATAEAAPCAACGTTEGYIPPDQDRPSRRTGERFGIDGELCDKCYDRIKYHYAKAQPEQLPCDLCGESPSGPRLCGKQYDLEGGICLDCLEELHDERALARFKAKHAADWRSQLADGRLYVGPGGYRLPVLDQHVAFAEYTPKLAALMIRREFRAMERRAS